MLRNAHDGGRRIDVQPDQPLGGAAQRHAQLIDARALGNTGQPGGLVVPRQILDLMQPFACVHQTDGVEVESLGFGGSEHARLQGIGDGPQLIVKRNHRQTFAGCQIREQVRQFLARSGRAVEHLVR